MTMNISLQSRIGINNAFRIARTEGHRIQWDATLDKKTRKAHRLLDGQIRELDEPFEIKGHKAMYPSNFGIPSLDINCRYAVLQRARWALDQDELETLKEQAKYYGLNKSRYFEDFKKKHLNTND